MALQTANQFQLTPGTSGAISRGLQLGGQLEQQFITNPQIEELTQRAATGDPQALTQLSGIAPERAQQLQQFTLGQQDVQAGREEARFNSVVDAALELKSIPSIEGKLAKAKQRKQDLINQDLPTQDTDEFIALVESGDIAGANALIDSAVNAGVQRGRFKAPPVAKLSSLQQKVAAEGLNPNSKEGFARAKELNQRAATDPSLKPTDQQVLNKANEGQLAAAGFANRVNAANENIDRLVAMPNFDPTSIQTAFFEAIPGGNLALSSEEQEFSQAKRDFITAVLRKESGAAIGQDEFVNEDRKFFPQVGDKPGVLKQKALGRKRAFENLKAQSKGVFDVQFENPEVFTGNIADMSDEKLKKALGL